MEDKNVLNPVYARRSKKRRKSSTSHHCGRDRTTIIEYRDQILRNYIKRNEIDGKVNTWKDQGVTTSSHSDQPSIKRQITTLSGNMRNFCWPSPMRIDGVTIGGFFSQAKRAQYLKIWIHQAPQWPGQGLSSHLSGVHDFRSKDGSLFWEHEMLRQ